MCLHTTSAVSAALASTIPPHSADPALSDTLCFLQNASFAHSGNYISRVRRTHRRKDIIIRLLIIILQREEEKQEYQVPSWSEINIKT